MLSNREGQRVPQVTFHTRQKDQWVDITTDELFAGKTVVVFSLPGAFTPTCSSTHVPGYNQLAKVFKENGVDDIICLSVNDAFVMNEWAKDQQAENIRLIPDGNGEFTEGMGMLVDKADLGFGKRSWRYSMLVKDGVIEKMFIEPEEPGDPFKVSDADTMLRYINPEAAKPNFVSLFAKIGCPFCARAKAMLKEHGMDYEEIVVGRDATMHSLKAVSGGSTVPQVFIDGKLIGGSEALAAYLGSK
ncbi:glutathione peroxidase [Aetokthonos hydrillicola Thurmond2011]|jgi:glutaredoxin-like protein|uniref:Glutathione peroxidase n=1 Tax=Aetokthonos hydrillicola Thurmond2011 TaxID=2712845 RepID=A0AAP5I8T8_9CYAN|nr:glutathione peroxidase [Aetokthonos hydrillicola]MBO3461871.1 glutathione peroxidase [Aetokthonos hydrillicola CCALA 1050]MBW4586787.1 glutathione peroxidase [Aetokthonos hydrillicola CCALA 1050]MDR9895854.1 glutathione peroxidase [Aetokthonos hydrillicola Thurmond2011]